MAKTGIPRKGGKRGLFVPENEPERKPWYGRQADAMLAPLDVAVLVVVRLLWHLRRGQRVAP